MVVWVSQNPDSRADFEGRIFGVYSTLEKALRHGVEIARNEVIWDLTKGDTGINVHLYEDGRGAEIRNNKTDECIFICYKMEVL